MNLLDAFAELDKLNEAYIYHGQYKSPYLNLSEAERQTAKDLWAKYSSKRLLPTSKGWVTPGWLDVQLSADSCKYILDYDTFHKAYDVEIADAGLLNMFDTSGALGPQGCYGNLKESGLTSKDSLYKVLIALWRWVHSEDERKKRLYTVDKSTADSMLQKATEEAEAYRKRQEAEQAKKEKEAEEKRQAESIRQTIENLLPDAIELVDQKLLDQLEEAGSDEIDIGFKNNIVYLNTNKFGRQEIPKKAINEYTADFIASLITEYLTKLDLPAKITQHRLGLDLIINQYGAQGYWVNTDTNEIFEANKTFSGLLNKKTKKEATTEELDSCVLALVKVSRVGRKQTYSATEDVSSDFYYSYNEELVLGSDLQEVLPYEKSAPLLDHTLTYYDNGFEEASRHGIFINFPTFDVWLHEAMTEYGNG